MSDEERLSAVIDAVSGLGKLSGLTADQDIYEAGLSSGNALELLLELESRFDVSLPDDQFIAARTPRALSLLIGELRGDSEKGDS